MKRIIESIVTYIFDLLLSIVLIPIFLGAIIINPFLAGRVAGERKNKNEQR